MRERPERPHGGVERGLLLPPGPLPPERGPPLHVLEGCWVLYADAQLPGAAVPAAATRVQARPRLGAVDAKAGSLRRVDLY